jgi:hypothetical protein
MQRANHRGRRHRYWPAEHASRAQIQPVGVARNRCTARICLRADRCGPRIFDWTGECARGDDRAFGTPDVPRGTRNRGTDLRTQQRLAPRGP